jgi:hypothetical protein
MASCFGRQLIVDIQSEFCRCSNEARLTTPAALTHLILIDSVQRRSPPQMREGLKLFVLPAQQRTKNLQRWGMQLQHLSPQWRRPTCTSELEHFEESHQYTKLNNQSLGGASSNRCCARIIKTESRLHTCLLCPQHNPFCVPPRPEHA